MAFEKLETRAASGRGALPATIALSSRGARPAVLVSLTRDLVDAAGFDGLTKCDAFLGTEADAGKLRIEQSVDGLLTPRVLKSKSFLLDLGFVERIGVTSHPKVFTSARVIETGVVEVDLPDFDAAARKAEHSIRPAEPKPATVKPTNPAKRSGGETVNGVTIDFTPDNETVTFNGKAMEVTARQARFVRLLARPRPQPVATSFLVNALWDGKPPGTAMNQLQMMAADLQKALAPIGLNLCLVKGVGYQLKDLLSG